MLAFECSLSNTADDGDDDDDDNDDDDDDDDDDDLSGSPGHLACQSRWFLGLRISPLMI